MNPTLSWPGKDLRPPAVRPLLRPDPANSFCLPRPGALVDNALIHGDNLPAMCALLGDFTGTFRCAYLDPPYNTGSSAGPYDDSFDHGRWLTYLAPRLELVRQLLREDGFLFVQISNQEMAYLKVLLDEVFGRGRLVNDIVWKRRGGAANPTNRLNNVTDYILWYARGDHCKVHPVYSRDDEHTRAYIAARFRHRQDGRRFMLAPIERNARRGLRPRLRYAYKGYTPRYGWMVCRAKLEALDLRGELHWNSAGRPNRRVFLEGYRGQPVGNLWTDIKVINPMARERLDFDGQKPEALLHRLLQLSTEPGDWVLDPFAGSGTTGAVAHKMGRRWVLIEQGAHCHTLTLPRLKRVIAGTDPSGITERLGWQGGGGVRCYSVSATPGEVHEPCPAC